MRFSSTPLTVSLTVPARFSEADLTPAVTGAVVVVTGLELLPLDPVEPEEPVEPVAVPLEPLDPVEPEEPDELGEPPELEPLLVDEGIGEALSDFDARREKRLPDTVN